MARSGGFIIEPERVLDAVVTAGGRLSPSDARVFGTDIKALVRVGGRTLLAAVVAALRQVRDVERIIVVGPTSAQPSTPGVDEWIAEYPKGEENLIAALKAAKTERIVFSASDLPFVTPASYAGLIALVPGDVDLGYPLYRRDVFLKAYPNGRTKFARLADGEWTGGSAFVLNRSPFLRSLDALKRAFGARKSLVVLAALLGPSLLAKFVFKQLRIEDVERRASDLLGARMKAVLGADPALGMDCDDAADFTYAHAGEGR
jgi:MobA-like NTP transferase protein